MEKKLKIGRSDFELIVKNGYYFVDKTMLIRDFYDNGNDILLIPRPRRFGKTLNLSMIEHFFDIRKPESKALFSGFKIAQDKEFCAKHQNKYPVINVSLKDVKETDWVKCLYKFKTIISNLYKSYRFLLKSEKFDKDEIDFFQNIVSKKANEIDYKAGLVNLSKYLQIHFGQEVIILVDEYDAPIISAFNNTNSPIKSPDKENKSYYEKVVNFMQGFLGSAYKGNKSLHKGMVTGVMRVGKESIFSEWNNFDVFGITMPYFCDSFGFTEAETQKMLDDFNLSNKKEDVKQWYDGYKFGDVENIYNPWSIVNYITKNKAGFKPYWVNSGDYSLIKSRIVEVGVQENIEHLIKGETIEKELHENFVFQDFEADTELLWTLLTDNGYLTQVEESDFDNHKLRIPNHEIKIVFRNIIKTWLNKEVKLKKDLLISTTRSLINNRIPEFERGFRQLVGDTFSYYDTAEKTEKHSNTQTVHSEQIYHVYTLGLLAILKDDYIIKSNKESGEGRYDIMLIPKDKTKNGIVIEIKSIKKQKTSEKKEDFICRVNKEIKKALVQIESNKYYSELLENDIKPEKIVKLAIVFVGKEPYIKAIKKN
ncbi:MAG: AAA family ATPase [Bacteroidia bacterium]|nr:MAG: AAA family ATPase [Bacteroidia bacterium]